MKRKESDTKRRQIRKKEKEKKNIRGKMKMRKKGDKKDMRKEENVHKHKRGKLFNPFVPLLSHHLSQVNSL